MSEYQLSFKVMLMINGFYPAVTDKADTEQFARPDRFGRSVILTVTLYQDCGKNV